LNSIIRNLKLWLILALLILSLAMAVTTASAEDLQVLLDADDGIEYDMERNITTARKNVRLTRGDLLITADRIVYYGQTGIIEATGNVGCQTGETEYHTDFLRYDILKNTGESQGFTATLAGTPRNFHIKGDTVSLNPSGATFSRAELTRCPKTNPDYLISARQIKFSGRKVILKQVIFKAFGVPVFYLPMFLFYTDYGIPQLEPDYDPDDGLRIKLQMIFADTETREWRFKGDLSAKGDANLGFALGTKLGQRSYNQTEFLYYYWHESWRLTNRYTYDTALFTFTADGFKEFLDEEETQVGLQLTRKFWRGPFGQWQAGVLARRVTAKDDSGYEYGGFYSGVRLDYKPIDNVKLSILGINSHSGHDFRDLMDDFGTGANLLYEVKIPLNSTYTFGVSGTYNLNDSRWFHEVYRLSMDSCCFGPYISYDRTDHSWGGGIKTKF
jgi:hypothetical protein